LSDCVGLLKKLPPHFPLTAIDGEGIADLCLNLAASSAPHRGAISAWATAVVEQKMTPHRFRPRVASVLYRVGLVGLKIEASAAVSWSFLHVLTIPDAAIKDDCIASICPVFYRTLGISLAGVS
jgi:hypothetical protein